MRYEVAVRFVVNVPVEVSVQDAEEGFGELLDELGDWYVADDDGEEQACTVVSCAVAGPFKDTDA